MKPINLLPYRPSTALADNPFSFFHAHLSTIVKSLSIKARPHQSSVSNHSLCLLDPHMFGDCFGWYGYGACLGAQTPAMSTVNVVQLLLLIVQLILWLTAQQRIAR